MIADPKWCPGCRGFIGSSTDDIDTCGTSYCEGVFTGILAGRLAALRAEVELALGHPSKGLRASAEHAERAARNMMSEALRAMRDHRDVGTRYRKSPEGWDFGYAVGNFHRAASKARRYWRIVADCRRWLEATR